MKKKDVIVSIQGRQFFPDPEEAGEAAELVTFGELSEKNGDSTLTYNEREFDGPCGDVTTLTVEPDRVTVLRLGAFVGQIVFQEGRRQNSLYDTDEGPMTVGIQTRHVAADVSERGGDIEVLYDIEVDHELSGINYLKINIRESGGKGYVPPPASEIICDSFIN